MIRIEITAAAYAALAAGATNGLVEAQRSPSGGPDLGRRSPSGASLA
jgi:hypothetical protein